MKPTDIKIRDSYDLGHTTQVMDMAKVLKSHIVKNGLFTNIKNKNYAHVEGWQFAGGLLGLFPRVTGIEDLSKEKEIKWMAEVEIVSTKTHEVVSSGYAICSNKENSKKAFDEYAILSMAQTRAIGKAYRNMLGWVMKLAGYEGTPAEEMNSKTVATEYDKSEVADDAKVEVSGTDTDESVSIPEDIREQKKRIVALLLKKNLKLNTRSRKEIEQEVADRTQLALTENNYPAIITILSK